MTDFDMAQAQPRVVAPGVVEVGPFFERHMRGGYFIVKTPSGCREYHWCEQPDASDTTVMMTRDEALQLASHRW